MNKIDYLKAAIEEVISIHFEGHQLSAHIAACSIQTVSHDLLKKDNKISSLDMVINYGIKPEYRGKALKEYFLKACNFFKHADIDSNSELTFNPQLTDIFIFNCIRNLHLLNIDMSSSMIAYLKWMSLMYPGIIENFFYPKDIVENILAPQYKELTRSEQLTLGKAMVFDEEGKPNKDD